MLIRLANKSDARELKKYGVNHLHIGSRTGSLRMVYTGNRSVADFSTLCGYGNRP